MQVSTAAPSEWASHCWHSENKLHQLSPYIGKLKSSIAADLLSEYTRKGDYVLDPFCGSGTIPLEAALMGRHPAAADASPYAYVLAMGKLDPPSSTEEGLTRLKKRLRGASRRHVDLRSIPAWVRAFFHPETLREAVAFADECAHQGDYFLLSCLLGILHHQRPGFLSYPSSHLVPYLRTNNFPRDEFPALYERRELAPRMEKKVLRALSSPESLSVIKAARGAAKRASIEELRVRRQFDAIMTSPPYMNALDYVRDNRLRMWFLDRNTTNYAPEPTDKREAFRSSVLGLAKRAVPRLRPGGTCVLVVGETITRRRQRQHPAELLLGWLEELAPSLKLQEVVEDEIPDVRRTRRKAQGTKKELFLVLNKRS